MIRTLIVDDEQHCINRLLNLIEKFKSTFEVIGTCNTVDSAIKTFKKLNPDLVFLDIEIHDKTGFQFLEQTNMKNFKVIFTTAFDEYAIKAFKYNAIDYLLKPIDSDDFKICALRIKDLFNSSLIDNRITNLLETIKDTSKNTTITIPTSNGFEILEIENIIHCKADTSYTYIYTAKNKILVSKPLKYYDDLLSHHNFFRIHNSHLINVNHVKKYYKGKGGTVTMTNNSSIDVSTRKKEEFLKLFVNQ